MRPLTDETNTMRPFAARSAGSTACVTAAWPTTLTSSTWRRVSIGRPSIGPIVALPALFTSASRRSGSVSGSAARSSALVTSSLMCRIRGFSAARASPSSGRRTPAMTSQPFAASAVAVARPMPRAAPVISTVDMRRTLRPELFEARHQLLGAERLAHVRVGAGLGAGVGDGLVGGRGEHEDRDARRLGPGAQAPDDLVAVEPGHHHVDDRDVDRAGPRRGQRFVAVVRGHDLVAASLEAQAQQRQDVLV